jgi:hypothetical protein
MSKWKTQSADDPAIDEEEAHSNRLFAEADRLEALAYDFLDSDPENTQALAKFTEAKALADAKRMEANEHRQRLQRREKGSV